MLRASLWVDGTKVDLFEDVGITITDSIKQSKDPATVFTAYSQQFRVPASTTNNKLFKHFESSYIRLGFDARRKHNAVLQINGADFQKGYVKLLGADMKNGVVDAYRLVFVGELSGLKEMLGDDLIGDLDYLDRYDHEFNITNVRGGFETGLEYIGGSLQVASEAGGEIRYPFLSHTRGFTYTTADGMFDITQTSTVTPNDRLKISDLKPAIQVREILTAMEQKYGFTFKGNGVARGEFIDEEPFTELYLWCHKNKGGIVTDDPTTNAPQWDGSLRDFTLDSTVTSSDTGNDPAHNSSIQVYNQDTGTDNGWSDWDKAISYGSPYYSSWQNVPREIIDPTDIYDFFTYQIYTDKQRYEITVTITPSGSFTADYNYQMYDAVNGKIYDIATGLNGTENRNTVLISAEQQELKWINPRLRISSDTLDEFEIDVQIQQFRDAMGPQPVDRTWNYNIAVATADLITVAKPKFNLPKIKCIDFLRAIFKMFNLVAYPVVKDIVSGEWEMVLKPLDQYYNEGKAWNITRYVDHDSGTVDRVSPYASIKFEYEEPNTFLAAQSNELTSREFGNLEWRVEESGSNDGGFLYDGGEYSVEVPLEKMQYTRIVNETTGGNTVLQWGWFVNDFSENEPEPELGKPLFMFLVNRTTGGISNEIDWNDGGTSQKYNAPSNVNTDQSQTLHFGAEIDEYTFDTNENSLFQNYYSKYIQAIFDRDARMVTTKAYLPPGILLNYRLNDKIVISDVQYSIDSLTANTLTGLTQLKLNRLTGLYNYYDIRPGGGICYAEDGYVEDDYWCLPFEDTTIIIGDQRPANVPLDNLVFYAPLEGSTTDLANALTNISSTGLSYVKGKVGTQAAYLNGSANLDYAKSADITFGDGVTDSSFSYTGWVKMVGSTTQDSALFYFGRSGLDKYAIFMETLSGATAWRFTLMDEANSFAKIWKQVNVPIVADAWHHFAATYDGGGDANNLKIYIDGVKMTAVTISNNASYTAMNDGAFYELKWGQDSFSNRLDCEFDALGIWNKELSQAEVTAIYDRGRLGYELLE